MNAETKRALNALNRAFYAGVARDFSDTRREPWPGWERALGSVPDPGPRALTCLDLGCGNGRFAGLLVARYGERLDYLGVDSSEALLAQARDDHAGHAGIRFERADFLDDPLDSALPPGPFDLVGLFGILHHVPGLDSRAALLRALAARLAPAGRLVVTAWQFGAYERFRARMLAWDAYNASAAEPIDTAQLEPGDHLLRWRDEALPRYCHHSDGEELDRLLAQLPLQVVDSFSADGKTNDLNRYLVLSRA